MCFAMDIWYNRQVNQNRINDTAWESFSSVVLAGLLWHWSCGWERASFSHRQGLATIPHGALRRLAEGAVCWPWSVLVFPAEMSLVMAGRVLASPVKFPVVAVSRLPGGVTCWPQLVLVFAGELSLVTAGRVKHFKMY